MSVEYGYTILAACLPSMKIGSRQVAGMNFTLYRGSIPRSTSILRKLAYVFKVFAGRHGPLDIIVIDFLPFPTPWSAFVVSNEVVPRAEPSMPFVVAPPPTRFPVL